MPGRVQVVWPFLTAPADCSPSVVFRRSVLASETDVVWTMLHLSKGYQALNEL